MVESEWSVEDLEWRESVSDTCSLVPYVEEIGHSLDDEDLLDDDVWNYHLMTSFYYYSE